MVDVRLLSTKIDWDKLRIFNHVAWSGSLTKASEKLAISQSAVSRQITALEETMGCRLFRRHARGLRLTEQGDLLFESTQEIFGRISNTLAILKDTKDTAAGHLRIASSKTFADFFLQPLVVGFLKEYPDVRLTHLISDNNGDLLQDGADLAITPTPSVQLRMIQRPLMTSPRSFYASEAYLKEHGVPDTLEDLDAHKLIAFGPYADAIENTNLVLYFGVSEDMPKRLPYISVSSIPAIVDAVQHGLGIAVLDDYIVRHYAPTLRKILTNVSLPDVTYYFIYPEELRRSKKISVFREYVMERLKKG